MRLDRTTKRRWMIAIALVGMLMGGIVGGIRLKGRRDCFASQQDYHERIHMTCSIREDSARERLRIEKDSFGTE
jgi:hypothetical protein